MNLTMIFKICFQETSYIISVHRPKTPPVSTISCHAVDGSPIKPETLMNWEKQPVPQYDHQVNICIYFLATFLTV